MDPDGGVHLLAVSADNRWVHGYPDVAALLATANQGDGDGEGRGGVDFFDSQGRRHAPVFDAKWQLVGLVETMDEVVPGMLERRLQEIRQNAESIIRVTLSTATGSEAAIWMGALAALEGTQFDDMTAALGLLDPPDQQLTHLRDPLHNAIAHGIF
jgi:hypothetical protein